MKDKIKIKCLILSDIHLSSGVSRSDKATEVIDKYDSDIIVINGDLIDSEHLTRLKKHDWKFLSKIRKLTKHHSVVVVKGNHDGGILDFLGDLLDIDIVESLDIQINDRKYHIVHGDVFDKWTSDWPFLTEFFTGIHYFIQRLGGKKQRVALFLKHTTKKFLRCTDVVKQKSVDFCKKYKYDGIITGHTHFSDFEVKDGIEYWNSGCFAEADGKNSYIVIGTDDKIELLHI